MNSWRCACPVLVALLIAVAPAAGQGPVSEGLLGREELKPHLGRVAASLRDFQRGAIDEKELHRRFPKPGADVSRRAAAADWYARALILGAMGDRREARDALESAVRAYDRFPEAHLVLANAELATGQEDEARRRLERLAAMDATCEPALLALGDCARREGDHATAAGWYDRAVRQHPDSVTARERKAGALVSLGRLPDALEEARAIRRVEGAQSGRFYALVAHIYWSAGDLIAACKALEKGVETCDGTTRLAFLRRLLGWYRLAANAKRMEATLDRLLAESALPASERQELEGMKSEFARLDEAAFLLWNYRWQTRAVCDSGVPGGDRLTALNFLCHVREGTLRDHLKPDLREELDLLWLRAVDAVTRSQDEELLKKICTQLAARPDPTAIPLLARLVHPSAAPAPARREAVRALAAAWRPALVPLFLQCLEDPDGETVRAADRALREGVPVAGLPEDAAFWRRWARSRAGQEHLHAAVDPLGSETLWDLVREFKVRSGEKARAPGLARAVMPLLRDPEIDPDVYVSAYAFLRENVDHAGWREGKQRVDPVTDDEIPRIAAAVERWYEAGPEAFRWRGRP